MISKRSYTKLQDYNLDDPLKGLKDLYSQVKNKKKIIDSLYFRFEKFKVFRQFYLLASPSREASESRFKNYFPTYGKCLIYVFGFQKYYGNGLVFAEQWFYRLVPYLTWSNYTVKNLFIEDINLENPKHFINYRIKITFVFEHKSYIRINGYTFLPIGNIFDALVKYPIWTNKYSFIERESQYLFDLYDYNLTIEYYIKTNVIHDGCIIDVHPNSFFLCQN